MKTTPAPDGRRFRLRWEGGSAPAPHRPPVVLLSGTAGRVCAPAAPPSGNDAAAGAVGGEAGMVLVIDDNAVFLSVVQRFFARHRIETEISMDGAASLERLRCGRRPALIVCDLHMPGINGADFLRRVRNDAAFSDIPVIILTSDRELEVELELVQLGADAFLTKDQDPRLLCAQVERLLRRGGARRAAA